MKNLLYIFSVVFLVGGVLTSCKKEKPTTVKVLVRDADNALVAGATVKIFPTSSTGEGNPTDDLKRTATTDAEGKVIFDYTEDYKLGSAGFAILDLEASKDALKGEGVVKVVEQEESIETIFIQ